MLKTSHLDFFTNFSNLTLAFIRLGVMEYTGVLSFFMIILSFFLFLILTILALTMSALSTLLLLHMEHRQRLLHSSLFLKHSH